MSELIGKVRINDEDWPGRDLYSDGAVEDELLEIAKSEKPEDFDRVVSARKQWPVMYHFSSVRGNILSWYPVKSTDRVLEIGSGCGAVTNALADRAASVTCVDLSKKRSLVNAYRNRDKDNIEIRLGNFQDVEKKLPCDYDIITLIGVFEYGSGYISSERPYVDFLKIISRHLAPGGKILIAIENRLGMKYLAGCTEDHTGKFFDGLENYPDTTYVRTFSRPELERIFDEAGFPDREFRYPYPDYKFALSIYSDDYLPKAGDLRNNMVNYDRRRLVLFDEAKAFDSMIDAGEFPMFSNSYFVTLSAPDSSEDADENAPAFIKYSNDRGAKHQIRTEIRKAGAACGSESGPAAGAAQAGGESPAAGVVCGGESGPAAGAAQAGGESPAADDFRVRKVPVTKEAEAHVRGTYESGKALEKVFAGTKFEANRCRMEGNAAAFEYVEGKTLEEHFDALLKEGKEAFLDGVKAYFEELDKTARIPFEKSDLFEEVFAGGADFGVPALMAGLMCPAAAGSETAAAATESAAAGNETAAAATESAAAGSETAAAVQGSAAAGSETAAAATDSAAADIDLIPANVIISGDQWVVIDYEWTFPCAVPIEYIKWRVIHYFLAGRADSCPVTEHDLIRLAGINPAMLITFAEMEKNFQAYASKDAEPLWKIYPDVSEGSISLAEMLGGTGSGAKGSTLLYFDRGEGFSESDILRIPMNEDGIVDQSIDITGVRALRIDPTECPVTTTIEKLAIDGQEVRRETLLTNGFTSDSETYVFGSPDPQIVLMNLPAGAEVLTMKLAIRAGGADIRDAACKMLSDKDRTIKRLKKEVESTELTLENVLSAVRTIESTKTVRAWRSGRAALRKSDPFETIRPALINNLGIHASLDRRAYQPDGIRLLGWVFDEAYEGERISVVNASGAKIEADIRRDVRQDVTAALNLSPDREVGFHIRIDFDQLNDLPLALKIENPRGILTLPLDIEPDPEKRQDHHDRIVSGELPYDGPVVPEYDDWAMDHVDSGDALASQRTAKFDFEPTVSVVIPLYQTPERYLTELLDSLLNQTYKKVEICLADGSPDDSIRKVLEKHYTGSIIIFDPDQSGSSVPATGDAAGRAAASAGRTAANNGSGAAAGAAAAANGSTVAAAEPVIVYQKLAANTGISGNTNEALKMASGEVIMLCDHDDIVEQSACFEIVKAFNAKDDVDLVYSDEDKVTAEGNFLFDPNFKPDFSPDFLCSSNYICHIFAFRKSILPETGFFNPEFDGAQDHDFILRCTEHAREIRHVRRSLYHWRAHPDSTAGDPASKMYAYENGRRAVEEHWKRLGIPAKVTHDSHVGHYRSTLEVSGSPLVSILIPNRNQAKLLKRAVDSILNRTTYRNFEILIVENGSNEDDIFSLYSDYAKLPNIDVITWKREFNFSAINNFGAKAARGEYLLLLNNDIEVTDGNWLSEMLGYCQREDVGAVGTLLYYPDGMIQHAGVILGLGGPAGHVFGGMNPADYPGGGRALSTQNVSAVTAACMMVKKSIFEKVGGLDEGYQVAFGDVDFCLTLRKEGLLIVQDANTSLIHHESASRGSDAAEVDQANHARFLQEAGRLRRKWKQYYPEGDPYYNPNLTLSRPDYSLKEKGRTHGPGGF